MPDLKSTKVCRKCGVEKPLSSFEYAPHGTRRCHDCTKEYLKAYYRRTRGALPRKIRLCSRCGEPAPDIQSRRRTVDICCAECRRRQAAARTRAWAVANYERRKARENERRNRKLGKFTAADIKRLMRIQKGKCAICRARLVRGYHVDHVMPLKRGGTNTADNIQLLCPTCNVRKQARDPYVVAQENGRLFI